MIVWVFHARCYLFVHQVRQRLFIQQRLFIPKLGMLFRTSEFLISWVQFVYCICINSLLLWTEVFIHWCFLYCWVFQVISFASKSFFYLQTDSVQSGRNLLMLGRNRGHPGGVTSLQSFNFYFGNCTFGVRKRACWQITLTVWPNMKCTPLNTIKPSKTHCFRV